MKLQQLLMAYSNANYLMNPNRLSTKVHHAPGGASSLSLSWEDPEKSKRERNKQQDGPYIQNNNQSPNFITSPSQMKKQESKTYKNYYEPAYPGYLDLSLSQTNRLLEEELNYYQNRNKMLRNNIFSNEQNLEQSKNFSNRSQLSYANKYNEEDYFSRSQDYSQGRGRQREELEMAILRQQQKRAYQRQESNYIGNYAMGQMGSQTLEKPSVKVSNPPGGRSSIIFG